MVKKQVREISNTLKKLFNQKKIDLSKVILFGSHAKKTNDKDSDIDLIIVSKDIRDKDIFAKVNLTLGIYEELVRYYKFAY